MNEPKELNKKEVDAIEANYTGLDDCEILVHIDSLIFTSRQLESRLVDVKASAEIIRLNNVALRETYLGVAKNRDLLTAELDEARKAINSRAMQRYGDRFTGEKSEWFCTFCLCDCPDKKHPEPSDCIVLKCQKDNAE